MFKKAVISVIILCRAFNILQFYPKTVHSKSIVHCFLLQCHFCYYHRGAMKSDIFNFDTHRSVFKMKRFEWLQAKIRSP